MSNLCEMIRDASKHLPSITDPNFGAAFDSLAGGARVVLIGDASHGTDEFYRGRAAITRHLIKEHNFNIVAVEADWPDALSIDRYVRRKPKLETKEPPFTRFPTWMWRNTAVHDFVDWLREFNTTQVPAEKQCGFYGLDLYSLYTSIEYVTKYLDKVDPAAAKEARRQYGCLQPWVDEPQKYGLTAMMKGYAPCENEVVKVLINILNHHLDYSSKDKDTFMDAEFNARLVKDAEAYYRAMFQGQEHSWNLRDTHMFETLERLLFYKGENSKAVIWAHNSHIGDARYTSMGSARKEINIGQLCRQRFGKSAVLIGFDTHIGTVAAASDWEAEMEIKSVNPSLKDSYERLMHNTGLESFWLDLRKGHMDEELREKLKKSLLERFIGVIYRPETERWSHYSKAILPEQFDAYVWIDKTTAVTPLPTHQIHHSKAQDETYPFGL